MKENQRGIKEFQLLSEPEGFYLGGLESRAAGSVVVELAAASSLDSNGAFNGPVITVQSKSKCIAYSVESN